LISALDSQERISSLTQPTCEHLSGCGNSHESLQLRLARENNIKPIAESFNLFMSSCLFTFSPFHLFTYSPSYLLEEAFGRCPLRLGTVKS
jgi:hypothetical protein